MTVTDLDRTPATTAPGTDAPLRARPGLHYAPVPGGVYFSGTRGQFVLSGSDLMYAVADGCVPLLEAGTTEDALVAEFGTERARPAVRHLVARLRENGLLLDPAAFTEPEPPAEVRARYADTLARLAARLDDPYAAFARLRRARVELRGPDTATAPARRGLHRAGVTTTPPTAGPANPLVPVCDPAMYADPALLPPAGDPAAHEPSTPAGDPAAHTPGTLTPTGDPAAHEPRRYVGTRQRFPSAARRWTFRGPVVRPGPSSSSSPVTGPGPSGTGRSTCPCCSARGRSSSGRSGCRPPSGRRSGTGPGSGPVPRASSPRPGPSPTPSREPLPPSSWPTPSRVSRSPARPMSCTAPI
ncbi:hypothetical protein [Streptomyces sp. NRRL S-37]|uniref:hypothetical protein n=1 Tax=Streptomyces sp. NRRL S-37 TaxID=1463903 RepID=UPI000A7BB5EE|nr:hypothetical protein [Streptomyces sp. NRRL S-37]